VAYRADKRGQPRVVRMVYEVATFQALRDQLRCKEIWAPLTSLFPYGSGCANDAAMRRVVIVLTVLALAACGLGGSSHTGPAAYLAQDATSVVLVQLNEDNAGHYAGSILNTQEADSSSSDAVTTENLTLTGQHHNGDVTLTIQAGLGVSQTWNGTLNGGTLALQIPQSNGTLQRQEFHKGDIDGYNRAVGVLRQQTEARRAAAAAQQQQQASADQQAAQVAAQNKAQTDVDAALAAITKDQPSAVSEQPKLLAAVQGARNALAKEQDALQAVKSGSGSSADCTAVGDLITNLGTATTTVGTAVSDGGSVVIDARSAVSTLQQDLTAAKAALSTLQQAGGQPSQRDAAAQTIAGADSAQQNVGGAADAADKQLQDLSNQASDVESQGSALSSSCNQNG